MFSFPPTIIFRHRKENLKKCSLQPLKGRPDLQFFTYPVDSLPPLENYVLLTLNAPILTKDDCEKGLFLIDGTWRHAQTMFEQIQRPHLFQTRSLPSNCETAYPRRQNDCLDPQRGLASVEALFLAYAILGRDTTGLLNHYYWREEFLNKNPTIL